MSRIFETLCYLASLAAVGIFANALIFFCYLFTIRTEHGMDSVALNTIFASYVLITFLVFSSATLSIFLGHLRTRVRFYAVMLISSFVMLFVAAHIFID